MYATHKRLLIVLFSLIGARDVFCQCRITRTSPTGYEFELILKPIKIIAPEECPYGYNFDVEIEYEINITGNKPPKKLHTLQGNLHCGDMTYSFFDLPNDPFSSSGVVSTVGAKYNVNNDCASATPASLECTSMVIELNAPGLRHEFIECGFVLPIELTKFELEDKEKGVAIHWTTASEEDNDFFTIERSTDASSWKVVAEVQGAANSVMEQNYTYNDKEVEKGNFYYRLKQTDFDRQFSYSAIRYIEKKPLANAYKIFPNPAQSFAQIEGEIKNVKNIKLYNLIGEDFTDHLNVQRGAEQIQLDLTTLPAGIYLLITNQFTQRIVKI